MSLNNPMDIQGAPSNYIQPSTSAPTANGAIASYPVGADELSLTQPIPVYQQPGAGAKDPYPTISGLTGPMGESQNPKE